ncbi:MAG: M20/M25/M40 family metallo-hydrolase [Algoriphagus sp.]
MVNSAQEAIQVLKQLIALPSFSSQEKATADLIESILLQKGFSSQREGNNVWAFAQFFDSSLPTFWLNSHHDTVKPNTGYTRDPFSPDIEADKLFGLGANDAGASLIALLFAFIEQSQKSLPYNLLFIASAEEETSGQGGMSSLIPLLPAAELVLVGEPTQMKLAVAEKGLLVVDAVIQGKAGHAAREEGINAIYEALEDLEIIRNFQFKKSSPFLGKSKVSCTVIRAGGQHNTVPDLCRYVLDIRVTEVYSHEEALEELRSVLKAELTPRSLRLRSSYLPEDHLMFEVARQLQLDTFGSPTLSDQALIPYPSVKIGPGDSARSHTADEYIFIDELKEGIQGYLQILDEYARLKRINP